VNVIGFNPHHRLVDYLEKRAGTRILDRPVKQSVSL
jgi:hypothetical protein